MKIDESLYKIFLEEINALDNFRMSYASLHPGVPLDHEDPDVKRLIEAMALFSARTKLAGSRNISMTRRRIFQQFFPYLLTPLPAMALLQAQPTRHLAETTSLPKGSEITIAPESGGAAVFKTMSALRILPITLVDYKLLLLPNRGFRLALRIKASFARSEEIGSLSFQINHLNNYEASQLVIFSLKHHMKRASVVFDEKASERTTGASCPVSFGLPPDEDENDLAHPLQKERLFFHFPWQELFFNVEVPKPPRNWTDFTICLDLNSSWPRNLVLNQDVFRLFVTPVINLCNGAAQPIICNGTQESYAIRHPDLELGYDLHSVVGVYEVAKEGMTPVKPGIFSGVAPSYEINEATDSQGSKRSYLNLNFPNAFQDPKTILTEALWLQSWFSETISQRLTITPFSRSMIGLKWELPVGIVPHAENLFQDNIDGFLQFLALTNKAILNRDDLMDILLAMGGMQQAQFRQITSLLVDLRIEKALQQGSVFSNLTKHRYLLFFREYDPSLDPLMETFLSHVENILDAWISGAKIEVRKVIPESTIRPSTEKGAQ